MVSNDTIWKYYAFTFLRDFALFSAVLVPFFTDWGGINQAQIQILQSWFMFWIFVLEVPTGAVADYLGRKHSLALGGLMVVLAVLLYGSIPSFVFFLLAEFLFAVSVALTSGADEALLYDALKEQGREEESKKIFGKANSMHKVGILIAAPIGSFIARKFGLNYPMLLSAIPFLLAALVAWSIKEPGGRSKRSESTRYLKIASAGFMFFYKNAQLRKLALDAIIVASSAYFVIWLYQPLLYKIGVDIFYFGFFHAFLVIVQIIVSLLFARFEKIFGSSKGFLRFSALITAAVFILAAILPNMLTTIFLIVFAGGFGLSRLTYMSAFINKQIPSEQRATVLSSISMFRRFALVVLNPVIGFAVTKNLSLGLLIAGLLPLSLFLFSPIEQEMLD